MLEKKWWHEKAAYQIYPKSFYDTNGDGIGDLKGVISKLDYLKDLGIDIIWLSPIYCSPLADQGYDISDYYDIDPRFGTMEDMDELLKEAKSRNMYIVMDLVVNHCSDEHEWFKKACEDPDGEYGKYFYIADAKDYKLPNNWRSYFGGPVWDLLPGHTDKYYMHVFHKKQPNLNWENPKLREEIYKMINWWLDRGVAGFRIDAIMNIKKPNIYTSYPADRDDGLASIDNMLHDAEGIDDFLHEMKTETFEKHQAFTVGKYLPIARMLWKHLSETMVTSLPCLILPKPSPANPMTDGTNANRLYGVRNTKKLLSVPRNAWGISDSSPISSKIMMSLAVSATISRKQTSATPVRKCLPLSTLCSADCLSSIRDRNLV